MADLSISSSVTPTCLNVLPPEIRKRLANPGVTTLAKRCLESIIPKRKATQIEKASHGSVRLATDLMDAFLAWNLREMKQEDIPGAWTRGVWTAGFGPPRDQRLHYLCWGYVGTDLVSNLRLKLQLDNAFTPLSPLYIMHYMSPRLMKEHFDKEGKRHLCYGEDFLKALKFIHTKGVPLEEEDVYDCTIAPALASPAQLRRITGVREFTKLEDALNHLEHQPLGASLAAFGQAFHMDEDLSGVFNGTTAKYPDFIDYHAVSVTKVEVYNNQLVAIVRMSNGPDTVIIRVSLTAQFLWVGSVNDRPELKEAKKVSYLLSDFAVPLIDEEALAVQAQGPGPSQDQSGSKKGGRRKRGGEDVGDPSVHKKAKSQPLVEKKTQGTKPTGLGASGFLSGSLEVPLVNMETSLKNHINSVPKDSPAVEVVAADYMVKLCVSNFRNAWESMDEKEQVDDYGLGQRESLGEATKAVIDLLGMQPCEGTEIVPSNARSHTCLLSGVYIGNVKVLARAQFGMESTKEIAMKLAVRAEDGSVAEAIHEIIQRYLG